MSKLRLRTLYQLSICVIPSEGEVQRPKWVLVQMQMRMQNNEEASKEVSLKSEKVEKSTTGVSVKVKVEKSKRPPELHAQST